MSILNSTISSGDHFVCLYFKCSVASAWVTVDAILVPSALLADKDTDGWRLQEQLELWGRGGGEGGYICTEGCRCYSLSHLFFIALVAFFLFSLLLQIAIYIRLCFLSPIVTDRNISADSPYLYLNVLHDPHSNHRVFHSSACTHRRNALNHTLLPSPRRLCYS